VNQQRVGNLKDGDFMSDAKGMSALASHPEGKSIEEQICVFSNCGFDSFFLSTGVTDRFEKIPFWAKVAQQHGIIFEAVHHPSQGVDAIWNGGEDAASYERKAKRMIEYCSEGGVSKLVIHVGLSSSIVVSEAGLAFWKELECFARAHNVKLCYENANTPELFEAVADQADSYHGICYDAGHAFCYTPDRNYISRYGSKLLYTHIHDNYGDGRDLHFLPMDGKNDWEICISNLNAANYQGTLNLELSCFYSSTYQEMSFVDFVKCAYNRLTTVFFEYGIG